MIKWSFQIGGQWYGVPYKKQINYTKKTGFQGIELTGYYGAWLTEVYAVFGYGDRGRERFRKHLDKLGLELAGIYLVYDYHDPRQHDRIIRAAKTACEFLNYLNSHDLVVGTALWTGGRKRDTTTEEMKTMANIFNEIGEMGQTYDVAVSVHPHYDGYIETKEEFAEILDLTDPELVGACPDVGWHYMAGDDPVEVIRTHVKRITHLHLKDARKRGHRGANTFLDRWFWELGKGKIDFKEIMRILKEANYSGWITVETEGSRRPFKSAIENKKYVDNVLSKIYM